MAKLKENKPKKAKCVALRHLMGVANMGQFKDDVFYLDIERAEVLEKQKFIRIEKR